MTIKLQPNFPLASSKMLEEMGSKILEGNPAERAAWVTSSDDGMYVTGVWEAQPYTESITNCPAEESGYIVSGELVITPEGEGEVHLQAGDSYFIPKGFTGLYSVRKTIVKVFHYNGNV